MNRIKFEIIKNYFNSYLNNNNKKKIFSFNEISKILNENKSLWQFPVNLSIKKIINILIEKAILEKHEFNFPHRKFIRYSSDKVNLIDLISSIDKNGYFTHYTAIYLNNLTDQLPKSIYFNVEQTLKISKKNELIQENIDRAFKNQQRMTNNITSYNNYKIFFLNSKNINKIGVKKINYEESIVNTTNIERTLIDIIVRTEYSGGIFQVFEAYKNAHNIVSINKLTAILKKMEYTYPYHQAIGFLLDKTGLYDKIQLDLLKRIGIKYNFYLIYNMKKTKYDKEWKIYYPENF